MTGFPWDVSIGLGIVLLGTGVFVTWILTLDNREDEHATKKRIQQENNQPQYPETD